MNTIKHCIVSSAAALLACAAPAVCSAAVQLGVEVFDALDAAAISAVKPGSLADANGLRRDDLIVQINGKRILSGRDLREELQAMARWKNARIVISRHGGFQTVQLRKRPFRAKPFVAANGMEPQSAEQCLRSPGTDCLQHHLLALLKSGEEDLGVRDAAKVSRELLRIGRPDLASGFLDLATEFFLARTRVLDGSDFVGLAEAYRAAGIPLPPRVLEKASQIAKRTIGLNDAVRGLHISGNTEIADRLLQEEFATLQARHSYFKELDADYFYSGIASGYALLGKMQSAEAVKLDPRFAPPERFKLDLAIADLLVKERRYEAVPTTLDAPLASYRAAAPSIDGDRFSDAAWLYWQSGDIGATKLTAEYLLARMKAGGASDFSRRGDIDATVEVLGLLGRIPEALTLIETSMVAAEPLRRAEVDYRLVSGSIRRSGQNELDPLLRPVVDRALANWRSAYAAAAEWPNDNQKSISRLYQWRTRNGADAPSVAEMAWQPGPSIDATARQALSAAIAGGVLKGLNQARRTDTGPAWVSSARDLLKGDSRIPGDLITMVMLMAADGHPDQAIQFGDQVLEVDWHAEVARNMARSINVPSLVANRKFDSIAQVYGTLTRPIQKMDVLMQLLIPTAGRCDTCGI